MCLKIKLRMMRQLLLLKPRLMLKPRNSEMQPKLLQEKLQPLLNRSKTGLIRQREMLRLLLKNWLMNKLL